VQTRIRFTPPLIIARTFWRFGSKRRALTLCAWLTCRPTTGLFPQISQLLAICCLAGAQAPLPSQAALPLAPAAPPAARALQIAFAAGDSRLPAAAQGGLKELAARMKAQESLRLQIVAYAAGGDLSASAARRLSLSRALAVRTFLIDNGVRSTRIDVRALGDKVPDQPANRVDLSFGDR